MGRYAYLLQRESLESKWLHAFHDGELGKAAEIAQRIEAVMSYSPATITRVTASGAGSYTAAGSGLYRTKLLAGGGGGGGGGSPASTTFRGQGGGGGGSGGTEESYQLLVGGTAYTPTVGAGGTGGTTTTGAAHNGAAGGQGGDSIFAGASTVHAPGGGGGGGGQFSTSISAVALVGNILTLTLTTAVPTGSQAVYVIASAAGSTWGSAGSSGAGINGAWQSLRATSGTTVDLLYANGGAVPSGSYTASTGVFIQQFISGGLPGLNSASFNQLEFSAGVGGAVLQAVTTVLGTGPLGLAAAGGGAGGISGATNGGTGGGAGTYSAAGSGGSGGGAPAGGTGSAGAANSGAGGGGGGAAAADNGGTGGAGGTGLIIIEGPF